MTDWIGATFTSDVGWDHLERLVDIPSRLAGTAGERRAAELTREHLEAVGARNARLEEFSIQGWERGSSSVETADRTHESIGLPRSPSDRVTGELVDLGYGLPEDFDTDLSGSIVLVSSTVPEWYDRFIHRREKYYRAVRAGAAGFIFANHVEGCLPPTGSVGTADEPIGEIPAVGVAKEVGARLRRRATGDAVTLEVSAKIEQATSQNVHAELGPDTETEILLTSHLDGHDISEGALDNGMGTALVVELAAALARREADLDRRVHIVCFGAEEVGLCGSEYAAERMDLEQIDAVVNNDGIGRGRTIRAHTHDFAGIEHAVETVSERFDHPISTTPRMGPHSDHWPFVLAGGVPGLHLMSETDGRGRGWAHTHADTIDKLESRTLRESAIITTELIVELASDSTTLTPRPRSAIVDALENEDLAAGMRLIGDLE
ncbi:M28 family peptidase [Halocatena halophila]|uniref:M28 family peptidase n=1 Tax=Halocatena halophila TaxID=2814576 RepID=UPI002ED0EF70